MKKLLTFTFLTVMTVNLLGTSGDITLTWTSPVLPKLYSNDTDENPFGAPIGDDVESWIGSTLNIGAIVGALPYGLLSERIGRKMALLSVAIPHVIAYLTLAFAQNVYLYYFARFLGGFALGGGYTLIPMYIAEIAEDDNRGMLSVTMNVFWTFGNLLPYVLGPYMPLVWFNVILACIPVAFFVSFFLVAPETPYYLLAKRRHEEAEVSLMKLRSKNRGAVEKEMLHIQEVLDEDEKGKLLDLFSTRTNIRALVISLVLIVAQQLSGINAVLFYTETIFAESGTTAIPSDISSIIIGLLLFGTSLITPAVVERLGRKLLLLVSGIGMMFSLAALGAFFYLKNHTTYDISQISFLPLLSLAIFIASYNFGFGPVPWTICSEIFPNSVKSVAASLTAAVCWTTSFLVTEFFEDLVNAVGEGYVFWVFGICCCLAVCFTFFFVPETRGKSFAEIHEVLSR